MITPVTNSEIIEMIRKNQLDHCGSSVLKATTDGEITRFEKSFGLTVPSEMREYLLQCNGAWVTSGSLYKLFSEGDRDVSIAWCLKEYPLWREHQWIPLGDDGCGDIYAIAGKISVGDPPTNPVIFLDQSDFDTPNYVVASDLWKFLFFTMENEAIMRARKPSYWPFNREKMIERDPQILKCPSDLLPWNK